MSLDAATWLLDSCGRFKAPCLQLWVPGDGLLREYYIDADGDCLLGRYWREGAEDGPDEVVMVREGLRYVLQWEQIPNRLVFQIW